MATEEAQEAKEINRQVSQSDFTCGCCYEVLVQPTSLICGHSFCRLCLAQWHQQSRKSECPVCRQRWDGCPKINLILR